MNPINDLLLGPAWSGVLGYLQNSWPHCTSRSGGVLDGGSNPEDISIRTRFSGVSWLCGCPSQYIHPYIQLYIWSPSRHPHDTGVYCVMSSPSPSTTGCKQEKLTVQSISPELKFLVALIQSLCPPHTFFSFSQSKLLWLGLARTNEFHKFWIKTGQKLCMAPKYQKEKKSDIYITKTVQEHMWKKTAKV